MAYIIALPYAFLKKNCVQVFGTLTLKINVNFIMNTIWWKL